MDASKTTGTTPFSFFNDSSGSIVDTDEMAQYELSAVLDIVQMAGVGLWEVHSYGDRPAELYANASYRAMLGDEECTASPTELFAMWLRGLDDMERRKGYAVQDSMRKGEHAELVFNWNHPTRGRRIFLTCCSPRPQLQGGFVTRGFAVDITDAWEKEMEHGRTLAKTNEKMEVQLSEITALNERLQFQYRFMESMSRDTLDMFILDVERKTSTAIKVGGKILEPDKRVERMYIQTWDYYIDKYLCPEDKDQIRQSVQVDHVVAQLQQSPDYSLRFHIIASGKAMNMQTTFTYLDDGTNKHIAFGFRCVDDIIRAEQQKNAMLQEANDIAAARLEEISKLNARLLENSDIIANSGYGIWRIYMKPDGRNEMIANDTLQRLFGTEHMNLTPEEYYIYYHSRLRENVGEIEHDDYIQMNDGQQRSRVLAWEHPTKGMIYLHAGGTSYLRPDGEHFISGYCGDVTSRISELERLNRERGEALERAETASRAKSAFLFSMSHDIRTPMNAIMGYVELMKQHIDDTVKCQDYLEKIRSSSDFLLGLINNVLEMARIESGKVTLCEQPGDVEAGILEVISVFDELMEKKGIRFHHHMQMSERIIYYDRVKVNEIMLNLISNAYKYTLEGGEVTLDIATIPCDREGYVRVRTVVKDTGIGMSQEFIPTIFEEFTRESTYTDNKIQGTGLGLPIVKQLIDLMGGTIIVESELGKGSTFTVELEHRVADIKDLDPDISDTDISTFDFTGKRILMAEDNDLNAEIAIELLSAFGIIVDRAEDGNICVERLLNAAPGYYTLILMDIQMPNLDGYAATRQIRLLSDAEKASIPIFAMTANAFDEDRQNALAAGMNGHLAKPIEIQKVMMAIAKVIQ